MKTAAKKQEPAASDGWNDGRAPRRAKCVVDGWMDGWDMRKNEGGTLTGIILFTQYKVDS